MLRPFAKPIPLVLVLGFCTFIPIVMSGVRLVEIPLGALPEDSLRFAAAPYSMWLHALGGALFGVLGPVQFAGVLRRRFGRAHRVTGRIFALAGLGLGLSGLSLLAQIDSISTPLLDVFRGLAGGALVLAIVQGVAAARARDIPRHRAWMIRAYAIGMGSGTIALVFFPIYIITGEPPTSWTADIIFVGWWSLNIGFAEWVVRRIARGRAQPA